jgi:hypothetical protein
VAFFFSDYVSNLIDPGIFRLAAERRGALRIL